MRRLVRGGVQQPAGQILAVTIKGTSKNSDFVIPAKAGIQHFQ